jgi:hypothetical protein
MSSAMHRGESKQKVIINQLKKNIKNTHKHKEQTNKQINIHTKTNKQTNKQANKEQMNKQTKNLTHSADLRLSLPTVFKRELNILIFFHNENFKNTVLYNLKVETCTAISRL